MSTTSEQAKSSLCLVPIIKNSDVQVSASVFCAYLSLFSGGDGPKAGVLCAIGMSSCLPQMLATDQITSQQRCSRSLVGRVKGQALSHFRKGPNEVLIDFLPQYEMSLMAVAC